jgi:hypothetical protein
MSPRPLSRSTLAIPTFPVHALPVRTLWSSGRHQKVHTGRRVVVRELSPRTRVAFAQLRGATSGLGYQWHVPRGVETLIGRAVELSAQLTRSLVVRPGAVVLEVQDQP